MIHAGVSGRVLLVGSAEPTAFARELALGQGWQATAAATVADALRQLREAPETDLVLLVPDEPLESHLELCRWIKFDRRMALTSVACLLPEALAAREADVFDAGADDCISAGVPRREVVLRLRKAIQLKQATDCLEDAANVVTALANAVEGKDHYTCGHVERVGGYCVEIARRLSLSEEDMAALRTGGVVHDIGKVGIPDQILNKPGQLTGEEFAVMQRHPVIGYDILKSLRTFHHVLPIVRWHHERPNGKGYPDGLKDDQLPLLPRIAAVADVFDALATDRPYRPAFPLPKCRAILEDSAAKGDLDEQIVRVMLQILDARFSAASTVDAA